MKFTVFFKLNTESDYGARLIVNVPFLRSWAKSVAKRVTYTNDDKTIEKIEIFVPQRLLNEIPRFFVGELKMLSTCIDRIEVKRA